MRLPYRPDSIQTINLPHVLYFPHIAHCSQHIAFHPHYRHAVQSNFSLSSPVASALLFELSSRAHTKLKWLSLLLLKFLGLRKLCSIRSKAIKPRGNVLPGQSSGIIVPAYSSKTVSQTRILTALSMPSLMVSERPITAAYSSCKAYAAPVTKSTTLLIQTAAGMIMTMSSGSATAP